MLAFAGGGGGGGEKTAHVAVVCMDGNTVLIK